jgi:putative hydrolase of the HAD superfamily
MTLKTLFLDIGGVLGTNGWDRHSRQKAVQQFDLDPLEFERRHKLFYDLHEIDQISLDEYLQKVVFWKRRDFTLQAFKQFMCAESKPDFAMINFMQEIKQKYHLTIAALSNEGRDIAQYRIKIFDLHKLMDSFLVSCFVHYQKPDPRIYQMAIDITGANLHETLYIDDRLELIEAAALLGIQGIHHISLESTKNQLLSKIQN